MFKKISYIKNMGVFADFDWSRSVRDKGNNVVEFEEVNILYGRNYSGKTTLSRVFRAIEKNELPHKCEGLTFSVMDDKNVSIQQDCLNESDKIIRVFNKDFVKENLHFIIDDEHEIDSFAVLGGENTNIEREIQHIESELGSEDKKTGLYGKLQDTTDQFKSAENSHRRANNSLEEKLRRKAVSIKENNVKFGAVIYDIRKIKRDIQEVQSKSYSAIDTNKADELQRVLRDEKKSKTPILPNLELKLCLFSQRAKTLVEKEIEIAEPIQELLNNAVLQKWVESGQELHKNKRDSCGFCGNPLPEDLWNKLDKHFNEESKQLKQNIETFIGEIESEESHTLNIFKIEKRDFYSNFQEEINKININQRLQTYSESLQTLKDQLEKRKDNITNTMQFQTPTLNTEELISIHNKLNELIRRNNEYSSELESQQTKAKKTLRLNEVCKFTSDIRYSEEKKRILRLLTEEENKRDAWKEVNNRVKEKTERITRLHNQLKDESKGAELINRLLNDYFDHSFLSLVAIKNKDESPSYQFEIRRNTEKAYNLSEGECGLIAFCYFVAKLDDIETKGRKPIIWIDDPVSSLDDNHIFFTFSLIDSKIVKPKQYEQLFISTHNMDFLKYLKRISNDFTGKGTSKRKIREFFLIERKNEVSNISVMPTYMQKYITEFNYLFHQIYKCAKTDTTDDENYQDFYNFGNNARKFLEIFLFYRYPSKDDKNRMEWFFGRDSIPQIMTDRINNEYSHLSGSLERGAHPVEATVPEMHRVASLILNRIKKIDDNQYRALLDSIDEREDED